MRMSFRRSGVAKAGKTGKLCLAEFGLYDKNSYMYIVRSAAASADVENETNSLRKRIYII